jgi:hypothetical protein
LNKPERWNDQDVIDDIYKRQNHEVDWVKADEMDAYVAEINDYHATVNGALKLENMELEEKIADLARRVLKLAYGETINTEEEEKTIAELEQLAKGGEDGTP